MILDGVIRTSVTGMIFLGFEIVHSQVFLVGKFGKYFLGGGLM